MVSSLGSDEEIQRIVNTYGNSILRLAYAYVKNRSDAEDIAQNVFTAYIWKAPRFDDEALRKAWLMRVTGNKCRDYLRSAWRRKTVPMPDDIGYLPDEPLHLVTYVLSLDEKYRIPIHLFYYEGYGMNEIAKTLHCSPATVGTWLSRGRKLLKAMMGDDFLG